MTVTESMIDIAKYGQIHAIYKSTGSTILVLMISGLAADAQGMNYDHVQKQLDNVDTLRFDFPGHGTSPGEAQILYNDQADVVRQLKKYYAEHKNIKHFILVGHSKGATEALLAADPNDVVISLSGRYRIYQNAYARYSPSEIEEINSVGYITKDFWGLKMKVTKESFEERKTLEETILSIAKQIKKIYFVHGTADGVIPCKDSQDFSKDTDQELIMVTGRNHSDYSAQDYINVIQNAIKYIQNQK